MSQFLVDANNPPSTVLIAGSDPYFHAQGIKYLRDRLRRNHTILDVWCQDDTKSAEVLKALDVMPLPFVDTMRRAVFVMSVQRVKDRNTKLISYLESPNADTTAVFVVDVGSTASGKFLTQLSTEGTYYNAKPLELTRTVDELTPWIRSRFEQLGVGCAAELCRDLHAAAGTDLFNLDSEVRKLATLCRSRGRHHVLPEDIAAITVRKVYPNSFDLCDALLTLNPKLSMSVLHQLYEGRLSEPDPTLLVVGALAKNLVTWSVILMMALKKKPFSEIAEVTKLHPYVAQSVLFPKLMKFKLPDLFRMQARLCEIDYAVKCGGDGRVLLDLFVLDFCGISTQTRLHVVYGSD
jgi:DNA polymerase III delta subunit